MEGYEVITSDDAKAGHVVEVRGDNLIVEHGTLFKSRHALPRTFVEADDGDVVVRAVAEHYGLAGGHEAPPSEGYGETVADDPAWGAERDRERAGMTATEEERARIRSGAEPGQGALDSISSPGLTGGDRTRDAG